MFLLTIVASFFFQKYSDQLTNTKGKISIINIKQKYYDIQTEILNLIKKLQYAQSAANQTNQTLTLTKSNCLKLEQSQKRMLKLLGMHIICLQDKP